MKGLGRATRLLQLQTLLLLGLMLSGCAGDPREALPQTVPVSPAVNAALPVLDCTTAQGVAQLICDDDELTALDRQLSEVLEAVEDQVPETQRPRLRATQQGWVKIRDECVTQGDKRSCVAKAYRRRIAELQAQHRLVGQRGPVRFVCGDRPANEVTVTWFSTDPKTLIAERGDSESLMYRQSGAGSDYRGRNESLSEHEQTITIVWGHGAPQITCQAAH